MSEIPEDDACQVCIQPTIHMCNVCGLTYCYGCEEQSHWVHCKCYEVCESEDITFLKASRDIQPGEIIFSELPLAFGPKFSTTEEKVPCVGCCRLLSVENCLQCPDCLWPVCNLNCEDLNHEVECKVFIDKSIKPKSDILLLLRVLLLQRNNKTEWERILEELKTKHYENESSTEIETFLEISQKFEEANDTFLLPKISNFLQTNTSELKDESRTLQIYYPTAHLIKHDCTPNTTQTIEPSNLKVTVRATILITKDTHIISCYTNPLKGTYARREDLKASKNISCVCNRCKDPTEFDTFFSALKCLGVDTEECGGIQLPVDPTNEDTLWICDKCKIELPNDQVVKFLDHLGKEVEKNLEKESTSEELEDFVEKLVMFLHPNHFHVCPVNSALIKSYTKDEKFILKKIKTCEFLIQIVKKFGCSLFLGDLLHELFGAKFTVLQDSFDRNDCDREIKEISQILEELKKVARVIADANFRKTVSDDVTKFAPFLL